ncbi:MAG TPA: hypothetical protein VMG13_26025, partial [Trebonia sp.]|nr:hypothetical protein [Trebonia sp.]
MPKHDIDPTLQQLVRAVNESEQGGVPVTISVHGTMLTGALIAQRRYFAALVERNPLMSALEPSSGLLGKEYAKDTDAETDYHLHIFVENTRDGSAVGEGWWRVSLEAVDGWT